LIIQSHGRGVLAGGGDPQFEVFPPHKLVQIYDRPPFLSTRNSREKNKLYRAN